MELREVLKSKVSKDSVFNPPYTTLQIGGMQLLHMEHDDPYEKTIPKVIKFVL